MKTKRWGAYKRKNIILFLIIAALAVPLFFGWNTKMPKGTSYISPPSSVSDIRLLYDLTYLKDEELIHEQRILAEQIKMIEEAEDFVVADIFLYNDYYNLEKISFPNSTQKLTATMIAQKQKHPDLKAYLITDEINNSYGPALNEQFRQMEKSGINVIVTDSSKVRDSNPLYAGYFRTYFKHFAPGKRGWLKNPFGDNGPDVSIGNYLRLLNFKANHRKVLITEDSGMVSSSNPHDGSSYHSNIAFQFSGDAVSHLLEAEKAVAEFSGANLKDIEYSAPASPARKGAEVRILTEKKIKDKILENIKSTGNGDRIDIGMFYLSHRDIIKQLLLAAERGANIRIILDPNKDAFGFEKNGIPNRQVASELLKESKGKIQVRWYMTHGEQFHTKVITIHTKKQVVLIGGSANYTRRNLDNYNLETDLMVTVKEKDPLALDFEEYFDRIWENQNGTYTADFSEYQDDSLWKVLIYRFQEKTGLCTF
ncbi:phospholipase D-like domain-containing protein [Peptoclostridium acidaminophilum]|nr:phospholipase D-like domain-containing protein [Peptoclostridium acidaminophilum]